MAATTSWRDSSSNGNGNGHSSSDPLLMSHRSISSLLPGKKWGCQTSRCQTSKPTFRCKDVIQIATRLTVDRDGVKLSPSLLLPSNSTGCLGVMNNYESLLPNKKALFDIPVALTAIAYLTSFALALAAFISDGGFNGQEKPRGGTRNVDEKHVEVLC